jgi:hypothetical protein
MSAQSMLALRVANTIRLRRADVKRRVAAGELSVPEVLERRAESHLASMPIAELLRAQHQWGADRAHRLLSRLGIFENHRLIDLSDRQTRVIAGMLHGTLTERQRKALAEVLG